MKLDSWMFLSIWQPGGEKMRFTFGVDLTRHHVVTVLKNILVADGG